MPSPLDAIKATVQTNLSAAQNLQAQAETMVSAHTALLTEIAKAETAVPTMQDIAELAGKALAAQSKT